MSWVIVRGKKGAGGTPMLDTEKATESAAVVAFLQAQGKGARWWAEQKQYYAWERRG